MDMKIKEVLGLMEQRASCRNYLDKEVEQDLIDNCLEAARLAPSACNKQPWRFKIITDRNQRERICSDGLLPGIPMPWLSNAPVIVVLCADRSIVTHVMAPMLSKVKYHLMDVGIAGEHFILAAEAQGLGSCWIGWFKERQIRRITAIPKKFQILSLISLGYPAEPYEQPGKLSIEEIQI